MLTSEKLRARREQLGKTQAEVAAAASMSTVQYNGYENDRHEPSAATMERLANALKTKPENLWYDSDEDPESVSGLIKLLRKRLAQELEIKENEIRVIVQLA